MTEYYLVTTKNLEAFFNALLNAQPQKVTQKFLEQLEFTSSNDRLYIGLLKALKFIDEAGQPQERYFKFLDQTESKKVLADAIRDAYSDLFAINKKANEYSVLDAKNKLKTIYQGKKSENVLDLIAKTFKALCDYADFSALPNSDTTPKVDKPDIKKEEKQEPPVDHDKKARKYNTPDLHYNIQIHLPESRDPSVYDAIFKSLKEHFN